VVGAFRQRVCNVYVCVCVCVCVTCPLHVANLTDIDHILTPDNHERNMHSCAKRHGIFWSLRSRLLHRGVPRPPSTGLSKNGALNVARRSAAAAPAEATTACPKRQGTADADATLRCKSCWQHWHDCGVVCLAPAYDAHAQRPPFPTLVQDKSSHAHTD
jgi:hypothetical protein